MQFRSVFLSIFIGTALIVAALLVTWENFVYGAPVFAPLLFANPLSWPRLACGSFSMSKDRVSAIGLQSWKALDE